MPRFRYTARQGDARVSGELEAASADEAARVLTERGLEIGELAAGDPEPIAWGSVSRDEAVELGGRIGDIVRSDLPLVSGLQALYAEIPSGRTRRALGRIIRRLEVGEPVEQVVLTTDPAVPPHVPAIIRAGLRTGKLGVMLEQYLGRTREAIGRRWQVMLGLLYPLILLAVGMLILLFFGAVLIPEFKGIYADFGVELPWMTLAVLSLSDAIVSYGWVLGTGLAAALAVVLVSLPALGGKNMLRRLVYRTPLVGTPLRFAALSEFCHLLAVLVEGEEPLPGSLRTCAGASHDLDLRRDSRILAQDVEQGVPLHVGARGLSAFPPEVVCFFRWDGDREAFVQALRAAGDIFDARSRAQVTVVAAVFEPFIIFLVVGIVAAVTVALFLPLIKLLNELS